MVTVQREEYGGWPNCYRLSNGAIDLVATADVGPRIIRFGFAGQRNEFKEYADTLGATGGGEWRIYGGHRLWVAPEDEATTYAPDNGPISVEEIERGVRLVQTAADPRGIEKRIEVTLAEAGATARVAHTLRNGGEASVTLAAWALSVMAAGGQAIVPLPPRGAHGGANLLPSSTIALWPYTDMRDDRWCWGTQSVTLSQDARATAPQKAGFSVPDGWCAHRRDGHVFVKRVSYDAGARYPGRGCNVEVYTDGEMLELETLGPLVELAPGAAVEHVEEWSLHTATEVPEDVRRALKDAE